MGDHPIRGESLALSRTAADGALCISPVALGLLADLAGSTQAPLAVCCLGTAGAVGFLGARAAAHGWDIFCPRPVPIVK